MVNKVMLIGNLGRDPEVRSTPSGQPVASFTPGHQPPLEGQGRQTARSRPSGTTSSVFGRQAEIAGQYLTKGKQIFVEGRHPDPLVGRQADRREEVPHRDRLRQLPDARQRGGGRGGGGGQAGRRSSTSTPTAAAAAGRLAAPPAARTTTSRSEPPAMDTVAAIAVAVVAALHVWFLVLEMFLWTTPFGRRVFHLKPEQARDPRRWPGTRASTTGSWPPASSGA